MANKWSKYNEKRKNFCLSDEEKAKIQNYIDNYTFTEEDLVIINDVLQNSCIGDYRGIHKNKYISKEDLVKYFYIMRFKMKIPTLHIARFLNISDKIINYKMRQLGWEYSKKESQEIAGKISRDYKVIYNKSRQTMLKNTLEKFNLSGSTIESYIRAMLNEVLTSIFDNNYTPIVGVNTLAVLHDGREVDIPIIILKNNSNEFYKFILEVNGDYWHDEKIENDKKKKEDLKKLGWKYLSIAIHKNYTNEEVNKNIKTICIKIKQYTEKPK